MNPTKILVSLLVVLYLIFFISNVFFPSAFPKEEIVKGIQDQIYFSKNKLGEITPKYDIVFKKGVFLTEKDFESKNTLIEFQCNSFDHCCAENENCNTKIEWTKTSVKFNQNINPITSTRCEQIEGTFFCKIYLGKIPAQVNLNEESFRHSRDFDLSSGKLEISAEVTNAGNSIENFAVMETKVFVVFFDKGKKQLSLVKEHSTAPIKIEPKETKVFEAQISIDSPGEYLVKTRITGMDFGFVEKEFSINVYGNPLYECKIDETRKEILIDPETIGENKIPECEIRYFCLDCSYAFECKYEWNKKLPEKTFELGSNNYAIENTRGTNCQ